MRLAICLALVALMTGPAVARSDGDVCAWSRIPMDLRQAPDPEIYEVQFLPNAGVEMSCRGSVGGSSLWGCARELEEPFVFSEASNSFVEVEAYWVIYIDNGLSPAMQHCVLQHEYAHLPPNNWCANHQGRCPP